MKTFLIEAFVDAVDGLWASVKLFWPIWGLMGLSFVAVTSFGNLKFSGNFKEAPLYSWAILAAALASVTYVFVIFCQGAVGWHRRLLLNEKARWTSLMPSRRSLQYALPAFLFVLALWYVWPCFPSSPCRFWSAFLPLPFRNWRRQRIPPSRISMLFEGRLLRFVWPYRHA